MAADDRFTTKRSYKTVSEYGQQDVTETKTGTFWIRIYNKKGIKLPFDTCLDSMPMLRGNSEFSQKSNKFASKLLSQLRENLEPGHEIDLENLSLRVYRKADAPSESINDDDDDEYYI